MASNPIWRGPRTMGWWESFGWSVLTWFVPALTIYLIGAWLDGFDASISGIGLGLAVLWPAGMLGAGFQKVPEQRFLLIERMGKVHSLKRSGARVINRLTDHIRLDDTFEQVDRPLFGDGYTKIDFKDVSTSVKASICGSIADPNDVAAERWDKVFDQVKLFAYRHTTPFLRIDTVVDSELRPALEALDTEDAGQQKVTLSLEVTQKVLPDALAVGFYPDCSKAIIIEDILLTKKQEELRDLVLEGEKKALQTAAEVQGPVEGVSAAQAVLIKANPSLNPGAAWKRAEDLVFRKLSLDALQRAQNLTLIGSDVGGVTKTLDVGASRR